MKINLKDIELVEALDDYIKIYIKPNPVLTLMTLKSIQEKIASQGFCKGTPVFHRTPGQDRKIQQNQALDRRKRDPHRQ